MNLLQICQAVSVECAIGAGNPVTVVGQTGLNLQLVSWANQSWLELQAMKRSWRFMQAEGQLTLTAGTREYTGASAGLTDLKQWKPHSFFLYDGDLGQANDENELTYLDWATFRPRYELALNTAASARNRPTVVTITPSNSIRYHAIPDKSTYVSRFEYIKKPTLMAVADASTPGTLPDDHHYIIVLMAGMKFYADQEAWNNYQQLKTRYREMLMALSADQLPAISLGPALA